MFILLRKKLKNKPFVCSYNLNVIRMVFPSDLNHVADHFDNE